MYEKNPILKFLKFKNSNNMEAKKRTGDQRLTGTLAAKPMTEMLGFQRLSGLTGTC